MRMSWLEAKLVLLYSLGLSVTIWKKWRTEESADWRQPELQLSSPWSPMSANSAMPACGSQLLINLLPCTKLTWWIWLWNDLELFHIFDTTNRNKCFKHDKELSTLTNFSKRFFMKKTSEWNVCSDNLEKHATYRLRNVNKTKIKKKLQKIETLENLEKAIKSQKPKWKLSKVGIACQYCNHILGLISTTKNRT